MFFNKEELHENLQVALSKLRDLLESDDPEIALESAKILAQLMLEIDMRQSALDFENLEHFDNEDEDGIAS